MYPPLKVGLASVAGLVAAGAVVAGAAFAQTPTAPSQTAAASWLTKFAQGLGKSEADVKAAALQATNQTIDEAVAAGKLTADQAAQLKARAAQEPFAGPFGGPGRGGPGGPGHFGELSGVAQYLGMQQADLMQALQSGKTLAQVAQEHGKSRDDLKTYLVNQEKARLDQAVKDGRLTQDQADQRLQKMTANVDKLLDSTMPPHGMGGRPGPNGTAPQAPSGAQTPARSAA